MESQSPSFIYRILSAQELEEAKQVGFYKGSTKDIEDGFIHFSTKQQVSETANIHYKGKQKLKLLKINFQKLPRKRSLFFLFFFVEINFSFLEDQIKWEKSRKGQLFPHLYTHLSLDQTTVVQEFNLETDSSEGNFQIPDLE